MVPGGWGISRGIGLHSTQGCTWAIFLLLPAGCGALSSVSARRSVIHPAPFMIPDHEMHCGLPLSSPHLGVTTAGYTPGQHTAGYTPGNTPLGVPNCPNTAGCTELSQHRWVYLSGNNTAGYTSRVTTLLGVHHCPTLLGIPLGPQHRWVYLSDLNTAGCTPLSHHRWVHLSDCNTAGYTSRTVTPLGVPSSLPPLGVPSSLPPLGTSRL